MTTTLTAPAARPADPTPTAGSPAARPLSSVNLKVTQARVLASEWIKLTSVRSWIIMTIAGAATLVGFGAIAASVSAGTVAPAGGAPPDDGPFDATDPTAISLSGATLTQLIVGVLGVLVISNEYANGSIRATFGAVPKRLPVLWAKVTALAVPTAVIMVASSIAAFLVAQVMLGDGNNTTLGADGVLRSLVGNGLYLAGVAVMGIAVGALLRNTAGAITVVVASLLIVPNLIGLVLPESWSANVTPYLPTNAGQSFTSVDPGAALLTSGTGALVFVGWLVVLLAGAAVVLRRRDS